ncbi:hypothetical protein Alg215_00052 [Pyrenophora tritici-repentis]|nr:hypothetical protein Alg215_00052 [Pyrenophora tritici-repentis]
MENITSLSNDPKLISANSGQALKWAVERYIPHANYIDQNYLRTLPIGLSPAYPACVNCGQLKAEPGHRSGLTCPRPCVFCKRTHTGLTCDMIWCTDNFMKERFGRTTVTSRPPNQRIKPGDLQQQLLEPIQPVYAKKVVPDLPPGSIVKQKWDQPPTPSDYKSRFEATEAGANVFAAKANALTTELANVNQQLLESKQREAETNNKLTQAMSMVQSALPRGQYDYEIAGSSYPGPGDMRTFGGPPSGAPSWQGHNPQQFQPA